MAVICFITLGPGHQVRKRAWRGWEASGQIPQGEPDPEVVHSGQDGQGADAGEGQRGTPEDPGDQGQGDQGLIL